MPIEMPVTVAALSHRRSGPGVRTIRMAMMAKGRISVPIYFEPAASPTRRPSRMARCGAGSCSNLISAASASTRKAATKISSLKRRACTMKERRHRGGRRRQGWQVGQHEPCQAEGGEHHDAAGQSAKHPDQLGQGGQIGRMHHECRGLRQIDHEQGMVVGVAPRADAAKLDEARPTPRRADSR